jgi:hypothetical protein
MANTGKQEWFSDLGGLEKTRSCIGTFPRDGHWAAGQLGKV